MRRTENPVKVIRFHLFPQIEIWCNGNTADFGSAIQGSNPCVSTAWVVTEAANGIDCKSIGFRLHWFESNTAHIIKDKTKESD